MIYIEIDVIYLSIQGCFLLLIRLNGRFFSFLLFLLVDGCYQMVSGLELLATEPQDDHVISYSFYF